MTSAVGEPATPAAPRSGFRYVDHPETYHAEGVYEVRIPAGITNKRILLRHFARSLKFPKYFGWNWDALDECLRDLSWLTDPKPIVVIHHDLPFRAGEDRRKIYLHILRDQIQAHEGTDLPVIEVVIGMAVRDDVERLIQSD